MLTGKVIFQDDFEAAPLCWVGLQTEGGITVSGAVSRFTKTDQVFKGEGSMLVTSGRNTVLSQYMSKKYLGFPLRNGWVGLEFWLNVGGLTALSDFSFILEFSSVNRNMAWCSEIRWDHTLGKWRCHNPAKMLVNLSSAPSIEIALGVFYVSLQTSH